MSSLASKFIRLAPNWTNPGFFSEQISVHFYSSQNVLKSDLKKTPRFVPLRTNDQSDPLLCQTWHPCSRNTYYQEDPKPGITSLHQVFNWDISKTNVSVCVCLPATAAIPEELQQPMFPRRRLPRWQSPALSALFLRARYGQVWLYRSPQSHDDTSRHQGQQGVFE